jgi:hypothetical protein
MPRGTNARRGRKPSIATAARHTRDLKKAVRALARDLDGLEKRLALLDKFYRSRERLLTQVRRGSGAGAGLRGKGPNVRDVALDILKKGGRAMNIAALAALVIRKKGGRAGANFTQNLGAALYRDRRFKRTGRGLYSAR